MGTRIKRVVGYIRVSSEMQVDEGHSLASQEELIQRWCRENLELGSYVLDIFRDEGLSGSLPYAPPRAGSNKYRPGLAGAVECLRRGEADYFVVYRLNRIYREFRSQLNFIADFFGSRRCKLVALAENVDLESLTGELTANLLGVISEYERKQIAQNLRVANANRRREGYPTGQIPYGWRRTPACSGGRKGVEPVPEQLQWVRRCFELALAGWGVREIAREMARLAAPPPGRTGRWDELKVHRLLHQAFHAGLIPDGQEVRRGVHWEHRVVEPEEFDRVQEALRSRYRERLPYKGKELRPLYNLGICGACGARLRVVDCEGVVAYRCPGSAAGGVLSPVEPSSGDDDEEPPMLEVPRQNPTPPGDYPGQNATPDVSGDASSWCPGWQRSADHVDQALRHLLQQVLSTPEFTALVHEEAQQLLLQENRAALETRRRHLRRALENLEDQFGLLLDRWLARRVTKEAYDRKYEALTVQKDELDAELSVVETRLQCQLEDESLLACIRTTLWEVDEVWDSLAPSERRQLVSDATEWVLVERTAFRHARLRLKLHFLPEQSVLLPHAHSLEGGYGRGPDGLTPRELALLYWIGQGKSVNQVAVHWHADAAGLYRMGQRIKARLHVSSLREAAEMAAVLIQDEVARLPLDVPAAMGCQPWRVSQANRLQQVLDAYRRGMTREQISSELEIAPASVRHYEWKLCKRLGVSSMDDALTPDG